MEGNAKVEKDRRIRAAFSRPWNVEKKKEKDLKKRKERKKKVEERHKDSRFRDSQHSTLHTRALKSSGGDEAPLAHRQPFGSSSGAQARPVDGLACKWERRCLEL